MHPELRFNYFVLLHADNDECALPHQRAVRSERGRVFRGEVRACVAVRVIDDFDRLAEVFGLLESARGAQLVDLEVLARGTRKRDRVELVKLVGLVDLALRLVEQRRLRGRTRDEAAALTGITLQ